MEKRGKNLLLWFCSNNYDELFYILVDLEDISGSITNPKVELSDSDILTIERHIYFILNPQEDSLNKFLEAYKNGKLYDFFGWEDYPLVNISSKPKILSKIIIEYAQQYINRDTHKEDIKNRIKLEEFNDDEIVSPVRLLVHHLLNKAYDPKLLDESILYMENCSPKQREGTFSILYKVLNPFELS
ncbi:MAG: hypothetical protein AAGA80_22680 [Cyanobacteria bacterium P01_F01_bin.143]